MIACDWSAIPLRTSTVTATTIASASRRVSAPPSHLRTCQRSRTSTSGTVTAAITPAATSGMSTLLTTPRSSSVTPVRRTSPRTSHEPRPSASSHIGTRTVTIDWRAVSTASLGVRM